MIGTMGNNVGPDGRGAGGGAGAGQALPLRAGARLQRARARDRHRQHRLLEPGRRRPSTSPTPWRTRSAPTASIRRPARSGRRGRSSPASGAARPDGSAVDSEGYLWNCRYGGGCVVRLAPDGAVERVVEMPCGNVTTCTFGGPDLADALHHHRGGGRARRTSGWRAASSRWRRRCRGCRSASSAFPELRRSGELAGRKKLSSILLRPTRCAATPRRATCGTPFGSRVSPPMCSVQTVTCVSALDTGRRPA